MEREMRREERELEEAMRRQAEEMVGGAQGAAAKDSGKEEFDVLMKDTIQETLK